MRGHDTGLDYHRMMLDDLTKMDAYVRAIATVVQPGDVVLDVGAGTGVLSMLAARAGAARVHAVESMPVARLADELVRANGLQGVVEVHEADLVTMEPIEPVDRVIGDWIGRFLVDDDMFDAVEAAVRWLKPEGTLHPDRIRLWVAPVGDFPVPMVETFASTLHGLDFGPARQRALNSCYRAQLGPGQTLGEPRLLVDWRCRDPLPPIDATLAFEVSRGGILKGVAGWFDARLAPEISLSSSPEHDTHWSQYLFPLEPRSVKPGERFEMRVRWDGERWHWGAQHSEWTAKAAEVVPPGPVDIQDLNQAGTAAFHAGSLSEAELAYARASTAVPPGPEWAALWENLGLARMNQQSWTAASRAFQMALTHGEREQSLRYLVVCLAQAGRPRDAQRFLERYQATYGPHPDVSPGRMPG